MRNNLLVVYVLGLFLYSACSPNQNNANLGIELIDPRTQTSISIVELLTKTPNITGADSLHTTGQELPPTATFTQMPPPDCADSAELIEETIPDQTVLSPGESFTKRWKILNSGSCTWNPDYAVIFVGGDQLSGISPSPINQVVLPNETIEVTLELSAPQAPGYYESFWKIRNMHGIQFGIGYNADIPLWIKIHSGSREVLGGGMGLEEPDWRDTFDEDNKYMYLGTNSITSYEIHDGNLAITAFKPIGDVWQIANNHELFNIYFEIIATTGDSCTGKDGYGVLLRAPDQPDGVIDSGYVFSFSCDGMYRIYRMEDGEYNSIQLWTGTENIKPGSNQTNRLGVRAEGNKFQLYANGELISEFFDERYSSGLFGIMIRSEATNNLKILIEEIGYWRIYK